MRRTIKLAPFRLTIGVVVLSVSRNDNWSATQVNASNIKPPDNEDEKRIVRERVAALLEPLISLERCGEIAVEAFYVSEAEFDRVTTEVYACLNGLEGFCK